MTTTKLTIFLGVVLLLAGAHAQEEDLEDNLAENAKEGSQGWFKQLALSAVGGAGNENNVDAENNADAEVEKRRRRRRKDTRSGGGRRGHGVDNNVEAEEEDLWGRRRRRNAPAPKPVDNSAMDSGMMWGENNAEADAEDEWGRRRRKGISGSSAAQWAVAFGAENNADADAGAGAAVCSLKVCSTKCTFVKSTGEENLQDFLGDATEEDLQDSQSWGLVKKAVKVPSFKSWFPPKKVCTKDAACVAANAKCGKTLATLHEQLGTLTAAADAAGKAKDAAKGDAAKVATAAKAAAALAESMKATAAADASAMQASVTEIAHLRVQAAMDKEDSAASQKALMTAMTNHKMLVQAHQKSKLLAVQAAARALGAESNAAKAAAAYAAAIKAHTDTASQKTAVLFKLGKK